MLIQIDLNTNDSESLLRHCVEYQPHSGDCREDSRLVDALEALAVAIKDSMRAERSTIRAMEVIDPRLLEAAVGLFQDEGLATDWLSKPKRALGNHRPIDVHVDEALTLITRFGTWDSWLIGRGQFLKAVGGSPRLTHVPKLNLIRESMNGRSG